ncbi:hypothetical protein Hanom_Chr05g00466531 [Helianthus anomalus]
MEISYSPGHLLLLKLLQREEDLPGHRVAGKERRLDTLKREVFQLCLFFFAFHGHRVTVWVFLFIDDNSSHRSPTVPFQFRFQVWVVERRFRQVLEMVVKRRKVWKRWKDIGSCLRGEEDAQRSEDIFLMKCLLKNKICRA